jgi:hypothetical protein
VSDDGAALQIALIGGSETEPPWQIKATLLEGGDPYVATLEANRLRELNNDLSACLERFKAQVAARNLDEAMTTLRTRGHSLTSVLAGGGAKVGAFLDFVTTALTTAPGAPAPFVDVRSRWPFPFELMLVDPTPPPPITDVASLEQACRGLLGFSAITRRSDQRAVSQLAAPDRSLGAPPLRLTYVRHFGLSNAEQDFFAEHENDFTVETWPDPTWSNGAAENALIQQIFEPRHRLADGAIDESPAVIQHFACHCWTQNGAPTVAFGSSVAPAELTAKSINDGIDALTNTLNPPVPHRPAPLVFLNACGTAKLLPGSVRPLPAFFLHNGNRGFIGTEIDIPDDFAAEFATVFYDRLLAHDTAGEALLEAKLTMVRRRMNPLGCVYAMYADPDIAVPR